MRPDRLIRYPPRLWKVDVVSIGDRLWTVCRTCGPVDAAGTPQQSLRASVLGHLARHARRDLTPGHLRTCQCGRSGCLWHRRHRGCAGVVVLALTHRARSPTWQLADTCSDCCAAMPSTAAVPEPSQDQASAARPQPAPAAPHTQWHDDRDVLPVPYDDSGHSWETSW